jgi:probable addiction module antidote protein
MRAVGKEIEMPQTTPFDPSEFLGDTDIQAELLTDALATGDAKIVAHALGTIARARGMSDIARATGLSRGSLYSALSGEGSPQFDTIMKVLHALQLELHALPKADAA